FLQSESARLSEALSRDIAHYMIAAWKVHNQRNSNARRTITDVARQEKLHDFVLDRWVTYLFPAQPDERPYLDAWRKALKSLDGSKDLSADDQALAQVDKAAQTFQEKVLFLRQATGPSPDEQTRLALLQEIFSNRGGLLNIPRDQVEKLLP